METEGKELWRPMGSEWWVTPDCQAVPGLVYADYTLSPSLWAQGLIGQS